MTSSQKQAEQDGPSLEELQQSHRDHERRLDELKQKAWLTPDEEMEEKRLKKLKLNLKDRMASLRRDGS